MAAHEETPSSSLSFSRSLQLSWPPSLPPGFPGCHHYYGATRFLTVLRVGFSSSELYHPYLPKQDCPLPAQDTIRPPRVMLSSVPPCRPHPRLSLPGVLWIPLPPVLAESDIQGFAPTGSPGFGSLGCSLVVCLRSFRFRLATDTLPFLATARIQLGRQVFHLLENSTAGHANTTYRYRRQPAYRAPASASWSRPAGRHSARWTHYPHRAARGTSGRRALWVGTLPRYVPTGRHGAPLHPRARRGGARPALGPASQYSFDPRKCSLIAHSPSPEVST